MADKICELLVIALPIMCPTGTISWEDIALVLFAPFSVCLYVTGCLAVIPIWQSCCVLLDAMLATDFIKAHNSAIRVSQ